MFKWLLGITAFLLISYIAIPVMFLLPIKWIYGKKLNAMTVPSLVYQSLIIFYYPHALVSEGVTGYEEWIKYQCSIIKVEID